MVYQLADGQSADRNLQFQLLADKVGQRPSLHDGQNRFLLPVGTGWRHMEDLLQLQAQQQQLVHKGAALRLVHEFESRKIEDIRREFTQIALDGEVSDDEKEMLKDVLEKICELELVLNEIELIGKKIVGEEE